ncbi:MAG: hypothetical protein COA67_00405 [Lutibacter sp.]|nr:MAG: hypothetical protein COA67_00405 [Lutibacter sp.]
MKTFKNLLLFVFAISLMTSCEELEDALIENAGGKVNFVLTDNSGHSFVNIKINNQTKNSSSSSIRFDPCDGGNYVGHASFSLASNTTYKVYDTSGNQIGSGNINVDNTSCQTIYLD